MDISSIQQRKWPSDQLLSVQRRNLQYKESYIMTISARFCASKYVARCSDTGQPSSQPYPPESVCWHDNDFVLLLKHIRSTLQAPHSGRAQRTRPSLFDGTMIISCCFGSTFDRQFTLQGSTFWTRSGAAFLRSELRRENQVFDCMVFLMGDLIRCEDVHIRMILRFSRALGLG